MTTSSITICRDCYDRTDKPHPNQWCGSDTTAAKLVETAEQAGLFTGPNYDNLLDELVSQEVYEQGAGGSSVSTLADRLGIRRTDVAEAVERLVRYGQLVTSPGPRGAKLLWTAAYGADVHVTALAFDAEDERLARQMREDYIHRYRNGDRKISGRTHDEDVAACLDYLRGKAPARAA